MIIFSCFLSTQVLQTPHDSGQTAPVLKRHILKKAIQYFEKEAARHVIIDVTATSKIQHKAKSEASVH